MHWGASSWRRRTFSLLCFRGWTVWLARIEKSDVSRVVSYEEVGLCGCKERASQRLEERGINE